MEIKFLEVLGIEPSSCSGSNDAWSYAYVRLNFTWYRQNNYFQVILWICLILGESTPKKSCVKLLSEMQYQHTISCTSLLSYR